MFNIKEMTKQDFPFAVQLVNTMNWGMSIDDFLFSQKLEPEGCFVLLRDSECIGIATNVIFDEVGWFGNFVIAKAFRGGGAGHFLLSHSIEFLRNKGVKTIGLYAYPNLVKFYENFGFKLDSNYLVMKGRIQVNQTMNLPLQASKSDIEAIVDFDRYYFGANRGKLLESILSHPDNLCYSIFKAGKIVAYVIAKVHQDLVELGPLVCDSKQLDAAVSLLNAILGQLKGQKVFTCLSTNETSLVTLLSNAGCTKDFQVARMFLGAPVAKDCIYLAESLERG